MSDPIGEVLMPSWQRAQDSRFRAAELGLREAEPYVSAFARAYDAAQERQTQQYQLKTQIMQNQLDLGNANLSAAVAAGEAQKTHTQNWMNEASSVGAFAAKPWEQQVADLEAGKAPIVKSPQGITALETITRHAEDMQQKTKQAELIGKTRDAAILQRENAVKFGTEFQKRKGRWEDAYAEAPESVKTAIDTLENYGRDPERDNMLTDEAQRLIDQDRAARKELPVGQSKPAAASAALTPEQREEVAQIHSEIRLIDREILKETDAEKRRELRIERAGLQARAREVTGGKVETTEQPQVGVDVISPALRDELKENQRAYSEALLGNDPKAIDAAQKNLAQSHMKVRRADAIQKGFTVNLKKVDGDRLQEMTTWKVGQPFFDEASKTWQVVDTAMQAKWKSLLGTKAPEARTISPIPGVAESLSAPKTYDPVAQAKEVAKVARKRAQDLLETLKYATAHRGTMSAEEYGHQYAELQKMLGEMSDEDRKAVISQ
jgi:hypothetical protein